MSQISPLPTAPKSPQKRIDVPLIGTTAAGEDVVSNGKGGEARITICVPTFKDGADALLASLIRLNGSALCTLLIFDDGSLDTDLTRLLTRQIHRYPGPARLISAPRNMGRSHARNRLMELAETDWILYLDADMQPDDDEFLNRYLGAIDACTEPTLISGGFSLRHATPTAETRLHAAQSARSECLAASVRAEAPGRYVFTSNLLVHRTILKSVSFDPGFQGWGWEDVDWGLNVANVYPIEHIDNPATHLGLDSDAALISKYASSADNFVRLVERHPDEMQRSRLYRLAEKLSRVPGRRALRRISKWLAESRLLSLRIRLLGLKLFRASTYAERL